MTQHSVPDPFLVNSLYNFKENPLNEDRTAYLKTIGYYAAFVAFGSMLASWGPCLPYFAKNTHSDFSQISLIFVARSLGFILGAYLGGWLFDRIPGHPTMIVTLVVLAAIAAVIPLVPLLWLLIALILMAGISVGIIEVGGNTLLIRIHKYNIGPWMNGLHLFFGIGAFLSPMIITRAIDITGDIKWGYWIITMIILLPAGWLLFLHSPVIKESSKGGDQDGFDYPLVILISLTFLFYVGAEVSFGGWIYTYTVTVHPGSETTAGYLTAGFWGALTAGRLLAIPISMYVKPRMILLFNFLGCLMSVAVILIWSHLIVAIWVGAIGLGFSMASIFATLLTFTQRRMKISGKANSWFFAGAGVGGMALPWLIGQVFETLGTHSAMVAILIDILISLGIFSFIMHEYQPRSDLPHAEN